MAIIFSLYRHAKLCSILISDPIRIVGGKSDRAGRVEIEIDGEWGTICDDGFGDTEADVICRQLGFAWAEVGYQWGGARFGEGTGPIHLDNLRCSGTEHFITDCPHGGIGEHNCQHHEDVSVSCEVPGKLYCTFLLNVLILFCGTVLFLLFKSNILGSDKDSELSIVII